MATTGKAKAAGKLTLDFDLEKPTPGTHRFKQAHDGDGRPEIGTLYITKAGLEAAGLADAEGITVTVEARK